MYEQLPNKKSALADLASAMDTNTANAQRTSLHIILDLENQLVLKSSYARAVKAVLKEKSVCQWSQA